MVDCALDSSSADGRPQPRSRRGRARAQRGDEEQAVKLKTGLYFGAAAIAIMAFSGTPSMSASAQQASTAAIAVGDSDIGGVVRNANGPEAGVWVIAQTSDLPTKYVKIVVTDDQGRYLLPHLPKANYEIWVRGYGLIRSAKGRWAGPVGAR
jgi:hypothetical protein